MVIRTKPFRGLDGRYHYTYLTTNNVNGKQYVGDRSCDKLPDFYIGSGTYFNRAKKKYGEEKFTKIILAFFPTRQQAHAFEEPMIKKYGTLSPNGYNESPTGGFGNGSGRHSEKTKKRLSERMIEFYQDEENRAKSIERQNRPEVKKKNSERMIEFYQDEENRLRACEQSKKMWKDKRFRKRMKVIKCTPAYIEKICNSQKVAQSRPDLKKKHSERMMELWKDPNFRAKRGAPNIAEWHRRLLASLGE